MNWTEIIQTAITICVPAFVTLFTSKRIQRQANKHSCRQSILQLIIEDKISVMEGKVPENYKSVLDEWEEYKKCYGNHYIDTKVKDYEEWFNNIRKEKPCQKPNKTEHKK